MVWPSGDSGGGGVLLFRRSDCSFCFFSGDFPCLFFARKMRWI
jgi:hypothetical protein